MDKFSNLEAFTYALEANEQVRISHVGNHIMCTRGEYEFTARPGSGSGILTMQVGLGFNIGEYEEVVIKNGDTAQTITVFCGYGEVIDNRQDITGVSITSPNTRDHSAVGITDSSATAILPQDNARTSAMLYVEKGPVWIGGSAVTASGSTRGLKFETNTYIVDDCRAALYAITDATTATADVIVMEISKT